MAYVDLFLNAGNGTTCHDSLEDPFFSEFFIYPLTASSR
jgi:hypothetical protein